ncbi:PolyQ domain-containing protein, partial [Danaus plexippus plexippus]
VVKRSKRLRQVPNPVPSETSMERLIEKMMVDMEDSDESSSYTLTNVTSARSDRSDCTESDQDAHKNTNAQTDDQNNGNVSTELHGTSRKREPLDVTIRSGLNGNSKEATIDFIQNETGPEIVVQKHKKFANGRAQNNSFAKERNADESWSNNEK